MQRSGWAAASAFIVACGGMTTGQSDEGGSAGAVSQGGWFAGGTRTGGTGTGGTSSGGFGTSGECRLGDPCTTPNSTCVNGDIECQCQGGIWSYCVLVSSGSGGAGSGGNATGGIGIRAACATTGAAARNPQALFFAIDATGSMRDIPSSGSTNGQRKWDVLKTVWPALIDYLPDTWAVGMMEWACPGCPSTAYSPATLVPIAPLDATQRDVLTIGLTDDVMGGYTPTECAYGYALDQVKNWQAPWEFEGVPRSIVLLTDGVPTVTSDCQTLGAIKAGAIPLNEIQYAELIATVAAGTTDSNISTFVVGMPGSDEPQGANYDPMYMLSLLAAAGGTLENCTPEPGTMLCPDGTVPALNALGTAYCDQHGGNPQLVERGTYCHYDLSLGGDFAAGLKGFGTSLQRALRRGASPIACEYPIPEPPPPYVMVDPTDVAVIYSPGGNPPVLLTPAPANDCANGGQWYYSAQDPRTLLPTQIDLCPDACVMAQAELDVSIRIQFGCL